LSARNASIMAAGGASLTESGLPVSKRADGRDKPGHDGRPGGERSLGRDIALVLLLKVVLLAALYLAFFRGDQRPTIDGAAMERHLVAPR